MNAAQSRALENPVKPVADRTSAQIRFQAKREVILAPANEELTSFLSNGKTQRRPKAQRAGSHKCLCALAWPPKANLHPTGNLSRNHSNAVGSRGAIRNGDYFFLSPHKLPRCIDGYCDLSLSHSTDNCDAFSARRRRFCCLAAFPSSTTPSFTGAHSFNQAGRATP